MSFLKRVLERLGKNTNDLRKYEYLLAKDKELQDKVDILSIQQHKIRSDMLALEKKYTD